MLAIKSMQVLGSGLLPASGISPLIATLFLSLIFPYSSAALLPQVGLLLGWSQHFSSSLSAIRVVSSAYLRLLIFLPEILIPACASSSSTFLKMYSAYKLNKQGDRIKP